MRNNIDVGLSVKTSLQLSRRAARRSLSCSRQPNERPGIERLEGRTLLSTLDYASFLGGSLTDSAFAVAADAGGNTYVTGTTASEDFPATAGAFDGSLDGIYDAFVAKFRADGSLAWATYLGGDGNERGHGIALDAAGNVFVTGRTDSVNFSTTAGSLDRTFNGGADAFVTKVSANGATLAYSTYLGGSGFEIDQEFDKLARRVGAIAVDAAGQAYVTGSTMSADFPTTAGAFRVTSPGFIDAFVSKLNDAGSALVYSTYLGGDDIERGHGIAVDAAGNAYVMGEVVSSNFPTTSGAFQRVKAGGFSDSFVTKMNAAGSGLVYSTYLGGEQAEVPGRLALDAAGQAYVTGGTDSFGFPVTAGAFQTVRSPTGRGSPSGPFDAYVTKLNAAGSGLVYSTYLGGGFGNDFGEAIAVDGSGQAHVTGHTVSGAFPVANAFQPERRGLRDAFVTKLNATGTGLVYSSYLGGGSDESGYGIAVDANATVHLVGDTISSGDFSFPPFPTTAGAFQMTTGGGTDAFVVKINSADEPPPPPPPALPSLTLNDVARNEGHVGTTSFAFTVTLSAASLQTVLVSYATANGTALLSNNDYAAASGTLTFAPGQTTKTITIAVKGDRRVEADESFFVNLSSPVNATLGDAQGSGTIINDDAKGPAPKRTSLRSTPTGSHLLRQDLLVALSFDVEQDEQGDRALL